MKSWSLKIVGYLLVLAALYWIFHDINWPALIHAIPKLNIGYALLGVVFIAVSYLAQGARWSFMTKKTHRLGMIKATQIIYIGLFSNEVLPLKSGEVVRTFLFSQWGNISIKDSFLLTGFERIIDATFFMALLAIVTFTIGVPSSTAHQEKILALIIFGLIVLIVAAVLLLPKFHNELYLRMRKALAIIPHQALPQLYFFTLIYFVLQVLGMYGLLLSWHIHLNVWTALAIYTIVHVGTAFPLAPSNIGSYQLFLVLALTFFAVDKTTAAGFSLVGFILFSVPMWVGGLIALKFSGLSWENLKTEARALLKNRSITNEA